MKRWGGGGGAGGGVRVGCGGGGGEGGGRKSRRGGRRAPNLYLIGFMGVGKSAVGRNVARQLSMDFIDSDAAIEGREGRSIAEIFAADGEVAFRTMEQVFVEEGHPPHGVVVACGGGLPLNPAVRERLLEKGVVICLFASVETILQRTRSSDKRPLLQTEDPEGRIRKLLQERESVYMETGIGVCADGRTLGEIARNVIRIYRDQARASKFGKGSHAPQSS